MERIVNSIALLFSGTCLLLRLACLARNPLLGTGAVPVGNPVLPFSVVHVKTTSSPDRPFARSITVKSRRQEHGFREPLKKSPANCLSTL